MKINSVNFPNAFSAMDKAAKAFWSYPNSDWQEGFLLAWAHKHDPCLLDELILEELLPHIPADDDL